MNGAREGWHLRIYCKADDHGSGGALHDELVTAARAAGVAGATVYRGRMGYGRAGRIYSELLSEVEIAQSPIVVEIIDEVPRIVELLPALQAMLPAGRLMTVQRVSIETG